MQNLSRVPKRCFSSDVLRNLSLYDLRFPTSLTADGSDAIHKDPDYSAAYCIIDFANNLSGHGMTFTLGRGTNVVVACMEELYRAIDGISFEECDNMVSLARRIHDESQIRWLGPEKGVVHMAGAALLNAVWDAKSKHAGKPLWRYIVDLPPEEIVNKLMDFKHVEDFLNPSEALEMLYSAQDGKQARVQEMERNGFPVYTTSAGWLGYSDEKINRLCEEHMKQYGIRAFKMKVGVSLEDDRRRAAIMRNAIGPDCKLMMDANQVWEVNQAIDWMKALEEFSPHWIEEPISPDDVLGYKKIRENLNTKTAGGECVHNKVMFKNFLQADALDFVQADTARTSISELLTILAMSKKAGKVVCPHAGGVGLCEMVRHLSLIDYCLFGTSLEGRMAESTTHLHEHFFDEFDVKNGRFIVPKRPGYIEMRPQSILEYDFNAQKR